MEVPYFAEPRENCDEGEIESGDCVGIDGTPIGVLGYVGRNDEFIAESPIPMRIRPASNDYWRSNPYVVNGAEGSGLYGANDFRFCYWMAPVGERGGRGALKREKGFRGAGRQCRKLLQLRSCRGKG